MIRETRPLLPDSEVIEALAISALAFLASRPDDLERFLSLTGIDVQNLRASAGSPGFLVGVIDFVLGDEKLLIAFAESEGISPGRIGAARRALDREA